MNSTDISILYVVTVSMILISIFFITHVIIATNLNRYIKKLDNNYMQRIDGIESLIKEEIKSISNSLKTK